MGGIGSEDFPSIIWHLNYSLRNGGKKKRVVSERVLNGLLMIKEEASYIQWRKPWWIWLRHGITEWMVKNGIGMICIFKCKLVFCGSGRIARVYVDYNSVWAQSTLGFQQDPKPARQKIRCWNNGKMMK